MLRWLADGNSCRFHCRVDFAVSFQPFDITRFSARLNLSQQFDDVRLEAWLTRIGVWDNRFDFDRHNESIRSDQSRSCNSFAWQAHGITHQSNVP